MASLIWPGDRLSEEELRQQHQELGLIPGWVDTSGNRYADNILRQGLLPQVDAYTEASKSPHPSGWPTAPYMHDSFATHPSQMADFGEIARRSLQSPETHVADSNLPSDIRAARQKNVVENLDQRLQEIENPSLLGFGMPEISYGTVGENPFNGIIPIAGNDPEAPYGSMGGWAQAYQGAPNMFADYGEAFRQAGLWDQPKETQNYLDIPTAPETQDAPWNFVSDEFTGLGTEGGPTKTGFGSIADQVAKDYAFPFLTGQEFSPYDQAQKTVEDFLANELITSDEANRMKGHQLASLNPVVNAAQAILYQPIDQWLDDRTQRPGTPAFQSILDGIKAGTQNILGTYSPGDTPVTAAYELMNEGYRSPAQIRASIPDMVSQVDSFSTRPTPGIDEAIINEAATLGSRAEPDYDLVSSGQRASHPGQAGHVPGLSGTYTIPEMSAMYDTTAIADPSITVASTIAQREAESLAAQQKALEESGLTGSHRAKATDALEGLGLYETGKIGDIIEGQVRAQEEAVAEAARQAVIAQQMAAEQAARSRQAQRSAEQAVVARNQPDRGLQEAEISRVANIITQASKVPVDRGLKRGQKKVAKKAPPKITQPVSLPEARPTHVPNYVWVGGLNGGLIDLNNPGMGDVRGPDMGAGDRLGIELGADAMTRGGGTAPGSGMFGYGDAGGL